MTMVTAYMLAYLFPPFLTSIVIILKEATLNQLAITSSQDFKDGTFYGQFDFSFLHLLGLHQDDKWFDTNLKNFMMEYI